MQNQMKFLRSYYPFNTKINGFNVEIALDSYSDIFNEYDPSPYRKKDVDPDLMNYLNECSSDIPLNYPIALQFNIPKEKFDRIEEKRVKNGFQSYYSFLSFLAFKEYKKLIRQSIWNVLVATILISLAIIIELFRSPDILLSVLSTCITIGGWVFLWQAITMFVFERNKYKNKFLSYKRFSEAIIAFHLI